MTRSKKLLRPVTKSKASGIDWSKNFAGIPMVIGYARVSRDDQDLGMQMQALRMANCDKIFAEKVSSVDLRRPQFQLMLKDLQPGDTLVCYAFNRLHRRLHDMLGFINEMKARKVKMASVTEPHIDPFTTNGRLLISVTGAVDENELGRISDRTRDGMRERMRQGQAMGRPRIVTPDVKAKMQAMRKRGVQVSVIARQFKIKDATVYANTTS